MCSKFTAVLKQRTGLLQLFSRYGQYQTAGCLGVEYQITPD